MGFATTSVSMDEQIKTCTKCENPMARSDFYKDVRRHDGLRSCCKQCFLESRAKYRAENPEKVREISRISASKARKSSPGKSTEWGRRNPDKARESRRKWELQNPDKLREKHRLRNQTMPPEKRIERSLSQYKRNKQSAEWRIKNSISSRINKAIKSGKCGARTEELLGYTIKELMAHLELQFQAGMAWDNHGDWHIDHIIPISSLGVVSYESQEFRRAWALPNLRPIWGTENMQKGSKVLHLC